LGSYIYAVLCSHRSTQINTDELIKVKEKAGFEENILGIEYLRKRVGEAGKAGMFFDVMGNTIKEKQGGGNLPRTGDISGQVHYDAAAPFFKFNEAILCRLPRIKLSTFANISQQSIDNFPEHASLFPEAVMEVAGLPGAKTRRDLPPWGTGRQLPEDAIEDEALSGGGAALADKR
jgi:hypothetical protein